jgi:uncharacterized membrane protein
MAASEFWKVEIAKGATWLLVAAAALAAGLTSCDHESTGLSRDPEATSKFPGLTVSDVRDAPAGAARLAAVTGVAYVSASPGTFSWNVDSVTVTNHASGATRTVIPVDGGFDPLPLAAEPDDEIEVLVHLYDGRTGRYVTRVPVRKRPRVVRTMPPKGATQVALTATAMIIFSEPVDGSTVTTETIKLAFDSELVLGERTLREDGLEVEFTPATELRGSTTYTLVITTGVRDLGGDPLEAEVQTTFTTQNSPPTATIASPADGDSIMEGHVIRFSGSGIDPEEGVLTGDALTWTSSLDEEIGTDTAFTRLSLSVGDHVIIFTSTDSRGATGSDTVAITVTAAGPSGYTVNELVSLVNRPACGVFGLGEPAAGTVLAVGSCALTSRVQDYQTPTVWTVTLDASGAVTGSEVVDLPVPTGFSYGEARAINDAGDVIAGGGQGLDLPDAERGPPVVWSGTPWSLTELAPLPGQEGGVARDVNDEGLIVGTSGGNFATVWRLTDPANPTELPAPLGGDSRALAVNNQGHVVGDCTTPDVNADPWHAILWRPPYTDDDACDLHVASGWPFNVGKTFALSVSDVNPSDGTVLVGGISWDDRAVVWQVRVADCGLVAVSTMDPFGVGSAYVNGIRPLDDGWEAIGANGVYNAFALIQEIRPVIWQQNGEVFQVVLPAPAGYRGAAFALNSAGLIGGWAETAAGKRAVLWHR